MILSLIVLLKKTSPESNRLGPSSERFTSKGIIELDSTSCKLQGFKDLPTIPSPRIFEFWSLFGGI